MNAVYSHNNVLIRLPHERWVHIIENHDDLAGKMHEVLNTVAEPDIIVKGINNELIAVKKDNNHWLLVIYKEVNISDGFIITAFITSRIQYILKKEILWKKQS